ncbi:MAG: HAD-IA family hydrolase [Candidatus Planktophila sp.]
MKKIGFLFDLDGTLVNSQEAVMNSWITMANEAGIPLEALAGHHGVPAEQTLRKVLNGREEKEIQSWIRRVTDLEISDIEGVHAVPGALELLAELNDREIPWTIVTSCTTDLAIARTKAGKIPLPASAVTFDQVTRGKPFPEPFILGANRIGLPPENCWAIEDAPGGVTSAKDAGCTVAGVLTTHTREELQRADYHLEHLNQLLEKAGLLIQ